MLGDFRFVLDPDGRDLWGLSKSFFRLDAATGKTAKEVPFVAAAPHDKPDSWRVITGIRRGGQTAWGSNRFGSRIGESAIVFDVETNEIVEVLSGNPRSTDRLAQFDLRTDQSPELVQTHLQRRPIGGGNATWRYTTAGYSHNRPVVFGNDVLMLSGTAQTVGLVARLDGETGEPKWATQLPRGAYSVSQSQFKDGSYGMETWSGVGALDPTRLCAISGDGTIFILDAATGAVLGSAFVDPIVIDRPKLVGDQLVIVTERKIVSVPLTVALGQTTLPAVEAALTEANAAIKNGKLDEAVTAAEEATQAWPLDRATWSTLSDAARHANDLDGAVRAAVRELELGSDTQSAWLRERFGLLARIETGPVRAAIADIGLFIYAASTDGNLYVIDPDRLSVDERRTMQADAQSLMLRGNQLVRRGEDRRIETVATLPHVPDAPIRQDNLFASPDDRVMRPDSSRGPVPREWTTVGGKVGRAVSDAGRLVRPLEGGGVRELVDGKVIDRKAAIKGVARWRVEPTAAGTFGVGAGGLFELDDDYLPRKFLIDLRDEATNRGMPEVLAADSDGKSLAVIIARPVWPRVFTIEIRSPDAAKVLRTETVLPPGRGDEIAEEPGRLFKLRDGYVYAGGELVWIPTDPAKPVWRFRANDAPERARMNVRNDPIDRSFGVPRVRSDKLFVGCRYGGVFAFDVNAMVR